MASFIARAVLCLIFGFFIYETINEFNKLSGRFLNPHFAIVPAVLVFLFQEWIIKKRKPDGKTGLFREPPRPSIDKIFYLLAWIFMAGFFASIVLVWAGAVYKQTVREYKDYTTTIR